MCWFKCQFEHYKQPNAVFVDPVSVQEETTINFAKNLTHTHTLTTLYVYWIVCAENVLK